MSTIQRQYFHHSFQIGSKINALVKVCAWILCLLQMCIFLAGISVEDNILQLNLAQELHFSLDWFMCVHVFVSCIDLQIWILLAGIGLHIT